MKNETAYKPDVESFASPYFFFANNPDQQVLYVSPSVQEILGYAPSDLIGRKYTDFLASNDRLNQDIPEMHRRRYQGDQHHFALRVVANSAGQTRVLKVQTCGQVDIDGQVVASHGIAEDVTGEYMKHTAASERLDELHAIEDQLSERERTVLQLVIDGRPNKSIAKQISITERAVEMVRARLVKKFAVESTAQLVSRATELRTLRQLLPALSDVSEDSPNSDSQCAQLA